ncbi:MAG: VTT domain-containing protein [Bacilli bacterium]|nr:VTT domain-containing protein [Bacilli bacterium]
MEHLIFFILCILQPICLPVPEATTILTGTLSLGPTKTFIIGMVGIMIGIIFMYQITHFLSKKFLRKLKQSPNFKAYQRYMSKYPILTTGLLFAIPVIPDEIICVGSALGNIKLSIILPVAFFSKMISIGMITYSKAIADILILKQWQVIILEIVIMAIASIIYQKINNRKKRRKTKKSR